MQQRSIALLQQMGIPVWFCRDRETTSLSIPLLWIHDQPDQLKVSSLWQGLMIAIQDQRASIVVTTPEKADDYKSPVIIWTSDQAPVNDEKVTRYTWSALCTQGEQKRQLWQQVWHALYR